MDSSGLIAEASRKWWTLGAMCQIAAAGSSA